MNRLDSLLSGNRHLPSMSTLLKMHDVSPVVQSHLAQVYTALTLTLLSASVGSWAHVQFHLGGMLTTIATFGIMMLLGGDADKSFNNRRLGYLLAFGFFKGCSIGSLVETALYVDPGIIVTAMLMTTTVFACFSAAALFSKRRSYLFLGGVLGSIVGFMCLMSLMRFFLPSIFAGSAIYTAELYVGLAVFCAYVLFDTQMIVEKASGGDRDSIWHAMELFIDFVAIFVRIVIILMRNQGNQNRREKEDRRRR